MMRRGMTFLELMIVVVIVAITAAMTLPLFIEQESLTATATARLLSSDLEHAQALALSRPEQRIALAVDADGLGWRIVDADAPMVAIVDAYDDAHAGRELAVRFGEGRAAISEGVVLTPSGRMIVFDPLGGLEIPGGNPEQLTVHAGEANTMVSVDPDTGFITLD
ncbi:MAG: prepilin-type N-terminal cleavage/methylation domain-containing protein [Phycisphaerales bacterium]|nr:prepilin-type N-terminal cleavage/methylation domain-containing protein [Phycisphaerales bacterium]